MRFPSPVRLTCEEQAALEAIVHRGKANARTVTRARILLNSADGWSTAATRVGVGCVSGDRDERAATLRARRTGGGLAR